MPLEPDKVFLRGRSSAVARCGAFPSVEALTAAIIESLEHRNTSPKPFVWTASVESILAKLRDCTAISKMISLGPTG